jgi:hypothetical protein
MSDGESSPKLMGIASDSYQLQTAQHVAAKKLLDYDGEIYPSDGCAITLSVLLQEAGIAVPDTYLAITLGNTLKKLAGYFCRTATAGRRWLYVWRHGQPRVRSHLSCIEGIEFR